MTPDNQAAELDLLIIGPVTRDLLPNGGWRLGGTALYGALAATRLGLRVGVVTRVPPVIEAALRLALPTAQVAARPAAEATTFENVYDGAGSRQQYLRRRGEVLRAEDVPQAWRQVGHALLAPLARDVDPALVAALAPPTRVAATPQGWLRQWDVSGRVSAAGWDDAATVLPRVEALILSDEDLGRTGSPLAEPAGRSVPAFPGGIDDSLAADPRVSTWRAAGAAVIVTQGKRGATLFTRTTQEHFPAFPVRDADPTGAGDVFAVALLRSWWWGGELRAAMRFANAAASFLVERAGSGGIPTYAQVAARLATSAADAP